MKSSTLNKIYAIPLTYPYFDEQALREIEPMDVRFRISTLEVTDKIAEEYGFPPDRVPEMILAQFQAGRHVAEKVTARGESTKATELSGIDKTLLSKYIQGKRPFSPSAAVMVPFAYNYMRESCHKLMFGTEGKILLPTVYAEVATAMAKLSDAEKEALLRKAKVQQAIFQKQNPQEIENAPHRNLSTLIGERLFELVYDQGTQGYQILGPETPYGLRNYVRQFFVDDFKRESPRLNSLMYLSFETGLALDYFIAEDFTLRTPCFYRDGDEIRELKDRTTLQMIGICSALPVEMRSKLMGEVIGSGLALDFASEQQAN